VRLAAEHDHAPARKIVNTRSEDVGRIGNLSCGSRQLLPCRVNRCEQGDEVVTKKSFCCVLCLLAVLAVGLSTAAAAEIASPAPKQGSHVARKPIKELQYEFLKLKAGMFIHFNTA
jgi:hypothetical protein